MNLLLVLVGLVGAVGGGALAVAIKGWLDKDKTEAETEHIAATATDIFTEMALKYAERTDAITALREQQAAERELRLERKIGGMQNELGELRGAVDSLTSQLKQNGIIPAWPPGPQAVGGNG